MNIHIHSSREGYHRIFVVRVPGTQVLAKDAHFARVLVRACASALPILLTPAQLDELARQLGSRAEIRALCQRVTRTNGIVEHTVHPDYLAYLLSVGMPGRWVLRYSTAEGWVETRYANHQDAQVDLNHHRAMAILQGWESPSLCATSGQ
jgi:hypothetical protein